MTTAGVRERGVRRRERWAHARTSPSAWWSKRSTTSIDSLAFTLPLHGESEARRSLVGGTVPSTWLISWSSAAWTVAAVIIERNGALSVLPQTGRLDPELLRNVVTDT